MAKINLNKVADIFHLAIQEPLNLRTKFVKDYACEDAAIKTEVLALLAAHQKVGDFLEVPAAEKLLTNFANLPTHQAAEIELGTTIGDYIIREKIGSGAFGEVYLAEDKVLARKSAVKVTPKRGHEGKTLAQLQHPHIISIYSQSSTADWHFVFMQYIDGLTLDKELSHYQGPKDANTFIYDLGLQLTAAMSFAHNKGILHLDIKPQNIIFNKSGAAFLGDFNISMDLNESTELRGGTPRYMAPEQEATLTGKADGRILGPSTDIFSFGVVMQDVLDHFAAAGSNPEIGDSFTAIVNKCCHENQHERFQSAAELHAAMEAKQGFVREFTKLPSPGLLLKWARAYPLLALIAWVTIPNILGSLFNIGYNDLHIVRQMSANEHALFRQLLLPFNLTVHTTLTILILFKLRAPISSMLGRSGRYHHSRIRLCSLRGHIYIAQMVTIGWLIGLIFWPSILYLESGNLQPAIALHFGVSFAIAWLISLSYSVLLAKFIFYYNFYPQFLITEESDIGGAIRQDFGIGLFRNTNLLKYLAGATPLIALLTLFWTTDFNGGANGHFTFKLLASGLAIVGLLGLMFSVQLSFLTENSINLFRKFVRK